MAELHHRRTDCRVCAAPLPEPVVPLAPQPLLTPDTTPDLALGDGMSLAQAAAPIDLLLCHACGNLQQASVPSPRLRVPSGDFRRATPPAALAHMEAFARDMAGSGAVAPGGLVVDLSSFDGSLLRAFAALGFRPLGVEPVASAARAAEAGGIPTIAAFLTQATAATICERFGQASLVTAITMSVGPHWCHIANIDDLDGHVAAVRDLLTPNGLFVFETQHAVPMVQDCLLDTIHHDHLSYFLLRPLTTLMARHGMEVIDALPIAAKGGSLRVTAARRGGPHAVRPGVAAVLAEEDRLGASGPGFYRGMAQAIEDNRRRLAEQIAPWRAAGRPVIGFGGSVGTAALIAQLGLAGSIDFLVDDQPHAAFFRGPGYDLPVLPSTVLYEREPGLVVLFAWRFADMIVPRHAAYRDLGGAFVAPLPAVRIL